MKIDSADTAIMAIWPLFSTGIDDSICMDSMFFCAPNGARAYSISEEGSMGGLWVEGWMAPKHQDERYLDAFLDISPFYLSQ